MAFSSGFQMFIPKGLSTIPYLPSTNMQNHAVVTSTLEPFVAQSMCIFVYADPNVYFRIRRSIDSISVFAELSIKAIERQPLNSRLLTVWREAKKCRYIMS